LLLTFLPILSYILQYYFSSKVGLLWALKNNGMVSYSDWLFIPFNFLWAFCVSIGLFPILALLGVSIILNVIMHYYWATLPEIEHFYNPLNGALLPAGIVHLIFSIIQTALVISFLFFSKKFKQVYFSMFILTLFFLSFIPFSIMIHGYILLSDLITCVLGLFVLLIKFILLRIKK
jgi:hypothetical protein